MSAISVHETDTVIAELPQPKGPGARLKDARQSRQLELDKVAAQLHLRPDMLVSLEADDYDRLPARVFVVGYLKNYARLVGLPPEAIIQALNNYLPADDAPQQLPKVGHNAGEVFRPAARARSSSFSLFSLVMLLGAVGLFFAWQKGLLTVPGTLSETVDEAPSSLTLPVSTPAASTQAASTSAATGADEVAPSSTQPTTAVVAATTSPSDVETGLSAPVVTSPTDTRQTETSQIETSQIETRMTTASANAAPVAQQEAVSSSAAVAEIMTEQAVTPVTVTSSTPVETAAPMAPVPAKVELRFTEACWVDVRDASGSFRYVREARPGTVKQLTGEAPWKITIGNVNGASLTINGEPFDLQRYNDANVARFSLDPASL